MSMKPGATTSPLASMVRAAWPVRAGPTAAIRSPSSATSAATAGAPLPSTTVPFLIRTDQAIYLLRVDDLDRLHLVALLDAVHDVHPRDDLAEDHVAPVQMRLGLEADVELAPRGVGGVGPRHGDGAAHVLLLVELVLDRVAGAARTVTFRVTALRHETRNDPVEDQTVVEALLGQRDEVLHRLGRVLGEELDLDHAALLHGDLGRLFHARGSFLGLCGFGGLGPGARGRRERDDHRGQQHQSDFHECSPPRAGIGRHYAPGTKVRARSTRCGIGKIHATVTTCKSVTTFATSPSSRTSTTARPRSSTPCSGSRASSGPTSTWSSASWIPSTSSARRASPSWPRTRPFITGT